jgi:hypothetical protein
MPLEPAIIPYQENLNIFYSLGGSSFRNEVVSSGAIKNPDGSPYNATGGTVVAVNFDNGIDPGFGSWVQGLNPDNYQLDNGVAGFGFLPATLMDYFLPALQGGVTSGRWSYLITDGILGVLVVGYGNWNLILTA